MSAKIAQALHQVMSSVGYIQKTGNNKFHGYKYAGEADLLEKLRPAMLEAGLILIPSITNVSPIDEHGVTTVQLEYALVHKDGDIWPFKIGAAGQGGDKNSKGGVGDKGLYKAITGANKYLLFKLFQIETGDDPENDSGHANGSARQNPHVTQPRDINEFEVRNDENGEMIDCIPVWKHRDVTKLKVADARPVAETLLAGMRMSKTASELISFAEKNARQFATLPEKWIEMYQGEYQSLLDELRARKAA